MVMAFEERGSGPVVVLLHGYPLGRAMWASQLVTLSERYRVIAPDLRGQGETPPSEVDASMDDLAADVVASWTTCGSRVGSSWGGSRWEVTLPRPSRSIFPSGSAA